MITDLIKKRDSNRMILLRERLVCTFFGIYTFLMFSSLVYANWIKPYDFMFSPLPKIAAIVLIVGCCLSVLMRTASQSYFVYFFLIFLGLLVKQVSTLAFPLWFFVMLLMVSKVDFSKLVKVFFYVNGSLTCVTIVLGYFNLIPTFFSPRGIAPDGTVLLRQALGFNWVTLPAQVFFYLVLAYIMIKKGKLSFFALAIISGISLFLYVETNTRNPFILEILIVLIFLLLKSPLHHFLMRIFHSKLFGWTGILIFPVLTFLSVFFATIGTNGGFMKIFDHLMSGRFALAHQGVERYGISLFGKQIIFNTYRPDRPLRGSYFYLDNSYIQYLLNFGLIMLFIIILLISLALYVQYQGKKWYVLLIFILIALHSFSDPQLIYLQYSPFILIIDSVIDRVRFDFPNKVHWRMISSE